ncbi:hypothetical protein ES705_49538 [subsurface metagenome]
MKVTRTFTVEQQGVGKPDYSREVSAGRERAGISLKYNQQLLGWGLCWLKLALGRLSIYFA